MAGMPDFVVKVTNGKNCLILDNVISMTLSLIQNQTYFRNSIKAEILGNKYLP